jgi:hypothetical protein
MVITLQQGGLEMENGGLPWMKLHLKDILKEQMPINCEVCIQCIQILEEEILHAS